MLTAEIIIPCFNEARNIENLIVQCRAVSLSSGYQLGFILVDNGSSDETSKILANLITEDDAIKYLTLADNQGYGGGILAGLGVSTSQIIGWTHADLQTPLSDCLLGLTKIQLGKDFVKGFRKGRKFSDKLFSVGMGIFESVLFSQRLREINAQPTMFRRDFLKLWRSPPKDFSLDLYALVIAIQSKQKIGRFPVVFLPRRFGESKWNVGLRSRIKFIKRSISHSVALRKVLNEDL